MNNILLKHENNSIRLECSKMENYCKKGKKANVKVVKVQIGDVQ